MEEQALLRIQEGPEHSVTVGGNFTREGWLYGPNGSAAYLLKESPILAAAQEVMQLHKDDQEYTVDTDELVHDGVLVPYPPQRIPVERFGEDEIAVFMFGAHASEYGRFLADLGRKELHFLTEYPSAIGSSKSMLLRQNWLAGHSLGSSVASRRVGSDIRIEYIRGIKRR